MINVETVVLLNIFLGEPVILFSLIIKVGNTTAEKFGVFQKKLLFVLSFTFNT